MNELGKVIRDIQPAPPGSKDWQPSAWSPRTQRLYIAHQNLACDWESVEVGYIAGTPYVGASVRMYAAPGDGHRGKFTAWDPVARRKAWEIRERFPDTKQRMGSLYTYGIMRSITFRKMRMPSSRVKLRQQVPELNFASDEKRGKPHPAHV